jgi:CHAT domain-containing protein
MNRDFQIALMPGVKEGELQIVLFSHGYPETGSPIETARKIFIPQIEEIDPPPPKIVDIDPSILGELRGDEGKLKVESAIKLVSDWVLGTDVRLALDTLIANLPDDTQVRIIFSADKRLRTIFDLTKVPVELIRPRGVDTPFAINPKVASILHLLDEVGVGHIPASALDWPLRVLIMRSNPKDLGSAVPEANPVRNNILGLGAKIGAGAVVVDVISSEPAVGRQATWEEFTKQLNENQDPYDIVIYLGHGSLKEEGGETIGCLQFEDGEGHKDIPAYNIVVPFQNKPVPVVLLVACQTADQELDEKFKNLHAAKMPQWIRGSQGVAQALINSLQSGTQLAVGMRYKLDTEDATRFLENFFDSLLRATPGNVEAAVHLARRALKTNSRFPAAFSAPVIFRRLRGPDLDEPLFAFIAKKKYVSTTCQGPEGDWKTREIMWDDLKELPWGQRTKDSTDQALKFLKLIEDRLIQGAVEKAALILPDAVLSLPGEKKSFAVKLHGTLGDTSITKLSGQLLFDREDIIIEKVQASPELKASGYKVLSEIGARIIDFSIEPSGEPRALKNLTLFDVNLEIGPSFNLWSYISVSGIQTAPQKIICPGINAIIVPPP